MEKEEREREKGPKCIAPKDKYSALWPLKIVIVSMVTILSLRVLCIRLFFFPFVFELVNSDSMVHCLI